MRSSAESWWRGSAIALVLLESPPCAALDIALHPQATIAASHATLDQVATLSGSAEELAVVGSIPVAVLRSSPTAIDARAIKRALATAHLPAAASITGTCSARQAQSIIPPEALLGSATAAMATTGDEATMTPVRPIGPLVIPDDGTPYALRAIPLDQRRTGQVPVRVEVHRGDRELARALVVLELKHFIHVAVMTMPVGKGQPIEADAIRIERREADAATRRGFTDPDLVLGRLALRTLSEGQVLTTDLVAEAPIITAGEAVDAVVRRGDIEVSAIAIAGGSGRIGERIAVRLTGDRRTRWARIEAPGRVVIE